jgi:hypothetical protein
MAMKKVLLAAVAAFFMLGAPLASANIVSVAANSMPWSEIANPSDYYGYNSHGSALTAGGVDPLKWVPPSVVALNAGDVSVTIAYQSSTAAFDGWTMTAAGVTGWTGASSSTYESGHNDTSGTLLPSYYTPGATKGLYGVMVAAFANSAGVMVGTPFEPGILSDTVTVPTGATELLLGMSIVGVGTSYTGSVLMDVTQNASVGGGVPEAPTYLMAALGFLAMAAFGARRSLARA